MNKIKKNFVSVLTKEGLEMSIYGEGENNSALYRFRVPLSSEQRDAFIEGRLKVGDLAPKGWKIKEENRDSTHQFGSAERLPEPPTGGFTVVQMHCRSDLRIVPDNEVLDFLEFHNAAVSGTVASAEVFSRKGLTEKEAEEFLYEMDDK